MFDQDPKKQKKILIKMTGVISDRFFLSVGVNSKQKLLECKKQLLIQSGNLVFVSIGFCWLFKSKIFDFSTEQKKGARAIVC